jgi:hypothetical protein
MIADNYSDYMRLTARGVYLECHSDGSGFYAVHASDLNEVRRQQLAPIGDSNVSTHLIDDESAALGVISGLNYLARHARDRAAAGGICLVHAQLLPGSIPFIQLGTRRNGSFPEPLNEYESGVVKSTGELSASLDDLGEVGPRLISAAALVLDQLAQGCGVPQTYQFSREGQIRQPYWSYPWRDDVLAWAATEGIEVV